MTDKLADDNNDIVFSVRRGATLRQWTDDFQARLVGTLKRTKTK